VRGDEADGDQLLPAEGADRERVLGLRSLQVGQGLVGPQDRVSQRPGLGERNLTDDDLGRSCDPARVVQL